MSKKTNKIEAVKFADFIKKDYISMCDRNGNCWWEPEYSDIKYTTEELFEEYLKQKQIVTHHK